MRTNIKIVAIAITPHLRRVAAGLTAIIALSFLLYGVFLLEAVAHAAARTEAQTKIQSLTSKLSSLEEQYLSVTKAMTPEYAAQLGLTKPASTVTVFASEPSGALSLRTQ